MSKSFVSHDLKSLSTRVNSKGYLLAIYKEHPSSWKRDGLVFFHRLVLENKLGRYLESDEFTHHVDGNRLNNDPENLELVSGSGHGKIHNPKRVQPNRKCAYCGDTFFPPWLTSKKNYSKQRYCSEGCRCNARRPFQVEVKQSPLKQPSAEKLARMVWSEPVESIAQRYGVSGNAVAKWCKKHEIKTPSRGYWQRKSGP